MKTLLKTPCPRYALAAIFLAVVQLVNVNRVSAQAPVCDGVTIYAIFNDSTDANANTPSIIAPVNSVTGVVGAGLGATGLVTIKKKVGGTTYYGSASLGVDPIAKRFYANSQMINPMAKDFFAINTLVVGGGQNVIATTPSASTANVPTGRSNGLDDYHFVKMTVNKAGTFIYALGVIRDTSLTGITALNANPLIRMNTCGSPTNCATIQLLGYLPPTPASMSNWHIYNGDMAFDNLGNLYYATVAFESVNSTSRYTDARLFRIKSTDIPTTVGTGTIPMTFIADYNSLDSTAMDGIAFDGVGAMYMTTKRFTNAAGVITTGLPSAPKQTSQLYKTSIAGTATLMPAFKAPAGYSIADLASCSFPLTLLASNQLDLSGRYMSGNTNLRWNVNDNTNVSYYEIQRSDDGNNFSTIARVDPVNTNIGSVTYTYADPQSGYGNPKYYRVREVMNGGMRLYSEVLTVTFNSRISLLSKPAPNPIVDQVNVSVQLKSAGNITARLTDQSGRVVYQRNYSGPEGENKLRLDGILHLAPGIYILELAVGEEIIREKLIKQ